MKSGFAFIVTHLEIEGDLPVEILDGYFFRHARDQEIEIIENILSQSNYGSWPWPAYNETLTIVEETGNIRRSGEKLPRDQWKYWVIAYNYDDKENRMHDIDRALMLLSPDIETGFVVVFFEYNQQGRKWGCTKPPPHITEKYTTPPKCTEYASTISMSELGKICNIVRSIDELNEKYEFINYAIEIFDSTKLINTHLKAKTILYFSIIEALVTHKPQDLEKKDSITHQIKSKMNLLQKKYPREIPISDYFGDYLAPKIWGILYDYRSVLAHGGKPDFEKPNKHKILKDQKTISVFLKENIKELILLALHDPEFIAGLKNADDTRHL
ncbi:MAG: hypothetical protein COA85_08830 [Robiginitomaculum sp.]|nr:MAG: hypothetical protein COA85_08830 [Robiginitomaculum sp.]